LSRFLRRIVRGPTHVRVALDAVGSRAFLLADGSRRAEDLAKSLEAEFGERASPDQRAMEFIGTLATHGMIALATAPVPPPPPLPVTAARCPHCGRAFHHAERSGAAVRCPACRRRA
jgi:hypothetical protein